MIGSQTTRSTRIPDQHHPLRRRGFWIGVGVAAVAALIVGGPHGVMAIGALVIVFAVVSWPVGLIDQHYAETTVEDWIDYGNPEPRIVYHQPAPSPARAYVVEVETGEVLDEIDAPARPQIGSGG